MKGTSRIRAIAVVLLVAAYAVSGCDDDGEPTGPNGGTGTPAQLVFIVQASDVTAGGAITPAPQVAVQDADGNLVTDATDPVTIALGANPGGGTLMGTTTVTPANGIAIFSDLSIDKVGAGFTLMASSGSLQSATSSPFDVSPGAPAALSFSVEPGDAEVNVALTPGVEVAIQDEFGNVVTTATDAVTLSLGANPGAGTLSGMTTVNAVDGVASFADLVIDRTGSGYTLEASSGALTSATSAAFDVVFLFSSMSGGVFHTCGATPGGAGYCWGSNFFGQLGDGNPGTDASTPTPIQGDLEFASVTAGNVHSCGLTTAGAPYCWGANFDDQLGDGNGGTDSSTPVAVATAQVFESLSTRGNHTCGVTTAGDAYCWGFNGSGQLGDGNAGVASDVPVLVLGDLSFASVSAGSNHTCGVTTDGTAYCWGANGDGRLGDGNVGFDSDTPVAVQGGLTFASVRAGGAHSCGVTTSDEAYCWGFNNDGQLGDGNEPNDSDVPVLVLGGLSFASVRPGGDHTCGVTTGGDAHCWGLNGDGELGDGNAPTNSDTPVPVQGGLNFGSLAAGGLHSCGVTTGGDGYCWGRNSEGQLGDGNAPTDSDTPVAVSDPQ